MVLERGQEDWDSEFDRFPRLFQGHESIPGLTWPTQTFSKSMTVYLGKRRVDLMHVGRAHTAGDIVAFVPDQNVMFTGDIVEYKSACYCGDGHFADWPTTLEAIRSYDETPSRLAVGMPLSANRWSMRQLTSPQNSSAQPMTPSPALHAVAVA